MKNSLKKTLLLLILLTAAMLFLSACGDQPAKTADTAAANVTPVPEQTVDPLTVEYRTADYTYTLREDGTARIISAHASDAQKKDEYIVPEQIDGHTVTALGSSAFGSRVIAISLPDTICEIEPGLFWFNNILERIHVSATNPYFATINGLLYSKTEKALLWCPQNYADPVEIPEGILSIAYRAMYKCEKVPSIQLPGSLTTIGKEAFYGCRLVT